MTLVLLDTGLSVNTWNALKFLLFQVLVSLFFATLWQQYIRRRTHRMNCKGQVATLFSSGIGRLTPAHLNVFNAQTANNPCGVPGAVTARIVLAFANILLFSCLLVAEYGSGSIPVYRSLSANATSISHYQSVVDDILQRRKDLDALYPLQLLPDDYAYAQGHERISVSVRVRNSSTNSFVQARTPRYACCSLRNAVE